MRKIEVSTDSVPELGTQLQIFSGGGRRGQQEKGRKRYRNRGMRRPGGRRQELRKHTRKRKEWQKNGQGQRKVTLKQRLEERREHHSHDTRRGT